MQYRLKIERLQIKVHLGWTSEERQALQNVHLNICITLPGKPKAMETDDLKDTLCYADIANALKQEITGQTFKLLEHLGECCYKIICRYVQEAQKIELSITKFLTQEEGTRTFELIVE